MCDQEQRQVKTKPGKQSPAGSRDEDCGCGEACGQIPAERIRYYTGKFMTARDFHDEQDYHMLRRYLHNRLLHGWGVVCGLKVTRHPNPQCADYVVMTPGIAIDCCGREIVLRKSVAVRVWEPPEATQEPTEEPAQGLAVSNAQAVQVAQKPIPGVHPSPLPSPSPTPSRQYVLIFLQYGEELSECGPVLYSEDVCGGDARAMEAGRVIETACPGILPWNAENQRTYAGCWPGSHDEKHGPCWKGCDDQKGEPVEGCLDPVCLCKLGVPLALIEVEPYGSAYRVYQGKDRDAIQTKGRPHLPAPHDYLTHIISVNWVHGGNVSLSTLKDHDHMDGKLKIYFERPLHDRPRDANGDPIGTPSGVNEMTFLVEIHRPEDVHYIAEYMYNDRRAPEWDKDECAAVFHIPHSLLDRPRTLADATLHITLKCDFISDCNGHPVAGNFHGEFPTHAPGTFESWFQVVEEEGEKPGPRSKNQEAD